MSKQSSILGNATLAPLLMTKRYFFHALLIVATGLFSLPLQANDYIKELVESYGFEYRPREEAPWGVRTPAPNRLAWIKVGDRKYKIELNGGLLPLEVDGFILKYLAKYAKPEVELISKFLLRTPARYSMSIKDVFISEYTISIVSPPVHLYRAVLPDFKLPDKNYVVECKFMFIEYKKKYHLVFYERRSYQNYDRNTQPHCDLS